jgi:ATP-dependent protease ClpP protease subunit
MSAIDELRAARLDLLREQTRHEKFEADYAEMKLGELKRAEDVAMNTGAEDNIFTFAGPVNDENVYKAMQTLGIFSRRDPNCTITIYLTSPGGSTYAGFAFHDFLKELQVKGHRIIIHVFGYAMSMAVPIFQAADERILSRNAFLLIHEVSAEMERMTTAQHTDNLKQTQMIQKKMYDLCSEKSNMTTAAMQRKSKKFDWLMDAEEALKHGLCDRIA